MKKTNARHLKRTLIFLGVLGFLPFLQDIFEPLKIKGLDGAYLVADPPKLSKTAIFSSKYQQETANYLKTNSSFRPDFVRLSNQIDYWLFNEINTMLTLGKENYIFDPNYISARKGDDYLSEEQRNQKTEVLTKTKTYLDSLNVPILFCLAPNKANYYPEYLPENTPLAPERNQVFFQTVFSKLDIPSISFDHLFNAKKKQGSPLLMPKYGAHWSVYGAYLSGLKMIESMESLTGKEYVDIVEESVEVSSKPRFTDADYLGSLNLIKKWKSPEMAYPKINFKVKEQPNVLIVSDSFFWTFYDLNIVQNCFSTATEMRYYNKTSYDVMKENKGAAAALTYQDIKDRDIIIVVSSAPGLKDLGYGFLEQLVNLYENK